MGVFLDSFTVIGSFHPISSWDTSSPGRFSVVQTIYSHRVVRIKRDVRHSHHNLDSANAHSNLFHSHKHSHSFD